MANDQTQNRKPTHDVCHVTGEGDKAYWNTIGAAWIHKDGKGMNLSLDYMPLKSDGRLVIRIRNDKTNASQGEGK